MTHWHKMPPSNLALSLSLHSYQTVDVAGCNVYGILRAGRSSSVEALVLSVPYLRGQSPMDF